MFNLIQECNTKLLCEAIKKKDKLTIQNLILNENININAPNTRGNTPLFWVITKFEDLDIMTMLLDKGADIHIRNHRDYKPLDVAIQNNKIKAVDLLIRRGALIGEDLNALLLKAIGLNSHALVNMLIDHGMQYNPSIDLKVSFNAALSRGNLKLIEHILPHCRFLNPSDKYIPRTFVIESQFKDCVELLLKWNFTINPYSNQDNDFIYAAVKHGYLPIVLQLLELEINVNLVNLNTGLSLLKLACLNRHHEIVKNLLKHNAYVNVTIPTDARILSRYYYKDKREYNYSFSSMYNEKDLWNITCLHIAVINSDSTMTKLLLSNGALIINDPTFFNITCFAVQNNCEDIVRIFMDRGVNVNDIDPQEKPLLYFCINTRTDGQDSKYNMAKLLLERGSTIHIQTPGNTLIFEAITNGHYKIAQLFLDYNADIQYINPDGDSVLHKAIENNFDGNFIRALLERNSPVDAVNNNMLTPLLVACKTQSNNQLEIIKVLLHWRANVNYAIDSANINSMNNVSISPLPFENLIKYLKDFTLLFEKGVNCNGVNNRGRTPLHFACKIKSNMTASIIELLLQHKANIEAADARGWTPLFVACRHFNDVAVQCLLDNNANTNHIDSENLTPLYIAAQYCRCNSEVVKILLERKVNVHCIDKQGKSIIHVIAESNNTELIERLAHTQINFNSVNKEGNTPLHIAVQSRSFDMTKSLIKYGANINILDKKNRTPLRNAIKQMSILRNKLENCNHRDSYWNRRYPRRNSYKDSDYIYSYINDLVTYKEIIKMSKIHVVKLKVAGLKVNTQNMKIVYYPEVYSDFEFSNQDKIDSAIDILQLEMECEREIEKMRTENIGVNNMTFSDLLKKNIHRLSRYVKNKKIQQTLDLAVYDEKFPLYIDIARSRFRDAKLRYRLVDYAKRYFSLNVRPLLPIDCLDTVFSYLNIKEIKMFIRSMKPLNK